ncbi:MAG: murein L,D-transpeptidase catalytic domain family protein [Paludibacteraceae bacterium]|nr:murein L,D-transpeptidase catalytic domain family protein [Paludibacteraceae bacterium]
MMNPITKIISLLTLFVSFSMLVKAEETNNSQAQQRYVVREVADVSKIHQKAEEAKTFVKKNNMNSDWCILIDFSYDLFTKRMFIYDLKENKIIQTALVSHGFGANNTYDHVEFSNVSGSLCSSEGKYRIGIRSYSNWGLHFHYKLHGLEKTNNNAYKRLVVLHSYELAYCDWPTTASSGCPVVCDEILEYIDSKIKASTNKNVLLWIFK